MRLFHCQRAAILPRGLAIERKAISQVIDVECSLLAFIHAGVRADRKSVWISGQTGKVTVLLEFAHAAACCDIGIEPVQALDVMNPHIFSRYSVGGSWPNQYDQPNAVKRSANCGAISAIQLVNRGQHAPLLAINHANDDLPGYLLSFLTAITPIAQARRT